MMGEGAGIHFVEGGHIIVEHAFIVVRHMKKFDPVFVPTGRAGGVYDSSHHIDELVLESQSDHHLLALGERDVRFDKNSPLADVQGPCHGVVAWPSLLVHDKIIKQIE